MYCAITTWTGKQSAKFGPLICKTSENGAKMPISTKYAVEKRHWGHRTGGTGNVSNVTLADFMNQTLTNLS